MDVSLESTSKRGRGTKRMNSDSEEKKTRNDNCDPPQESSLNSLEADLDENFEESLANASPLFVHQYHIVKKILKYLGIKDLLQASQVNRQWNDIGRIVRSQRKNWVYKILFHPFLPHTKEAFQYFNNFEVSDVAKRIVESGEGGSHFRTPPTYNDRDISYPDLVKNAKTHITSTVENDFSEIQMIIGFGTKSFDKFLKIERKNSKASISQRMKLILGELPERIPCFLSFSFGLVATPQDSNNSLELESRSSDIPCLTAIGIPKVPGLRMKLFTVSKRQNLAMKGQETAKQFKSLFGIEGETESNLKGILFLHKSNFRSMPIVDSLHEYLKSNPNVALAGGIHDQILTSRNPDDRIISTGVLIYGDELVNVSTVALSETDTDMKKCRVKLEKLKRSLVPGGSSFAFMFACNGRGLELHRRPHVEAELFNSVFPETPLLGAFTYGELCHEVMIPFNSSGQSQQHFTPPRKIRYEYNTIFLIVSFKHPVVEDNE